MKAASTRSRRRDTLTRAGAGLELLRPRDAVDGNEVVDVNANSPAACASCRGWRTIQPGPHASPQESREAEALARCSAPSC